MRYDLIAQTIKKKSDPKNWKTVKIKVKSLHRNKKSARKQNFCSNTDFSLYFKIRLKKFPAEKPLACSLHFLFRRDWNHYSNLTSKVMKTSRPLNTLQENHLAE